MRETKHDKMGIGPEGRRKVNDSERYSVGDLLSRALVGRNYVRWSEFVRFMQSRTAAKPSHLLRLQSFIMDDAPFLAACGLIDPRAVEEVIKECGGLNHLRNAYNVTNDPRGVVSDRHRLIRNQRYLRALLRNGEINGGSGRKLEDVLVLKVPLSGDRPLFMRLIVESGFNGTDKFSKISFKEKVEGLGFTGDLKREEWDFGYILSQELSQPIVDAVIQQNAVKVTPVGAPERKAEDDVPFVKAVVVSKPAPVAAAPAPPAPEPVVAPAVVVAALKAPEPPTPPSPPPAPVSVAAEVKKPVVECAALRAVAHRGFTLMLRVLKEEHAWPYERLLLGEFVMPMMPLLWAGAEKKPDVYADLLAKNKLVRSRGRFKRNGHPTRCWNVEDVELLERGSSSMRITVDDVRKIIKDAFPNGLANVILEVGRQNPEFDEMVVAEPISSVAPPKVDVQPEAELAPTPIKVEPKSAPAPAPAPPPPAPVSVATEEAKKPVITVDPKKATAHRGLVLMTKVLRDEHGWPFGNVLPNCFVWPITKQVWPSWNYQPIAVNGLKKCCLLKQNGRLGKGYLWEILDVQVPDPGEGSQEISVADVRKFIAAECPDGLAPIIEQISLQNPQLKKRMKAALQQPSAPVLVVAEPKPDVPAAPPAQVAPPKVAAPLPPPPAKTLQQLFNELTPEARSEFVTKNLEEDVNRRVKAELKARLKKELGEQKVILDQGEKDLERARAAKEKLESVCDNAIESIRVLELMLKDLQ